MPIISSAGADRIIISGGPAGGSGPEGASAYEVWLAAGNTGTVQQFLSSLQGRPGIADTTAAIAAVRGLLNSLTVDDIGDLSALLAERVLSGGPIDNNTVNGRTLQVRAKDQLNFLDYGGKGDGVALNDIAFGIWRADIIATGKAGYVPAGRYKFSGQINFSIPGGGVRFCVRGDDAVFLTTTTTAPAVQIVASGGTGNAIFYPIITGLRFETNVNGVGATIGRADLVDQVNSGTFDFIVNNSNNGANVVGLQLNGIFQSDVKAVVNCFGQSSGKAAIQVRQTQFSTLRLAAGHAAIGLHLTDGYSYGNAFIQTDIEENDKSLVIDSTNAVKNTFAGGTFIYRQTGITATAGSHNLLITPVIGGTTGAPGPAIVSSTGLLVVDGSSSYVLGALGYTPLKTVDPVATNTASVSNGGKVLQLQVGSDGTAYITNYTNSKPTINQVQAGGNHAFLVGGNNRFLVDATTLYAFGLPTAPGTLPSGALWRDSANGNVIKVVP